MSFTPPQFQERRMRKYCEIAENCFWRRKWLFFWRFDRERASRIAYELMAKSFHDFTGTITVEEDRKILEAIVDFIRQNVTKNLLHVVVWIAIYPANDPRRFAIQMAPVPWKNAQVEWTYDFRPGSKIQGRQLNEY